jgi:large subunit ribosomal protein L21
MYAVIKTGGKQYRVQAGDVLVVEKLSGEPGAKVDFDQVLMLGDGAGVTVGAPTVAGAVVSGTLVETRKGVKIKVFKKIRRQGYRRTGGHRQIESVVKVTAITGAGVNETWDGEVDLTPLAELNLRARNLAARAVAPVAEEKPAAKAKAAPKAAAAPVEDAVAEAAAPAVVAEAPAKPKAAPKAKAAADDAEAPAKKAAPKAKAAAAEGEATPAKKPAAKKAKPADDGDA